MIKNIESMGKNDRYEDIARRANMDKEVIKHVLKHAFDSYVTSLQNGEKVVIPGYGTSEPIIKTRKSDIGLDEKYVHIKQHASGVLIDRVNSVENFKIKKINKKNILVDNIDGLS